MKKSFLGIIFLLTANLIAHAQATHLDTVTIIAKKDARKFKLSNSDKAEFKWDTDNYSSDIFKPGAQEVSNIHLLQDSDYITAYRAFAYRQTRIIMLRSQHIPFGIGDMVNSLTNNDSKTSQNVIRSLAVNDAGRLELTNAEIMRFKHNRQNFSSDIFKPTPVTTHDTKLLRDSAYVKAFRATAYAKAFDKYRWHGTLLIVLVSVAFAVLISIGVIALFNSISGPTFH